MREHFEDMGQSSDQKIVEAYFIPEDGKEGRKEEVERVRTIRRLVKAICENVAELVEKGHPQNRLFDSEEFINLQDDIYSLRETLYQAVDHARAGSLVRTTHMLNKLFDEFDIYSLSYTNEGKNEFDDVIQKIACDLHDDAATRLHNKEGYSDMIDKLNNRAYEALEDKFYLEALVELMLEENKKVYEEIQQNYCEKCGKDDCFRCKWVDTRDNAYRTALALEDIQVQMYRIQNGQPVDPLLENAINRLGDEELKKLATRTLLSSDGQPCRYALAGRDKRQLLNTSQKYIRNRINDNFYDAMSVKNKEAHELALKRMMEFKFYKCDFDSIMEKDAKSMHYELTPDTYSFFDGRQVGQKKEPGKEKNED